MLSELNFLILEEERSLSSRSSSVIGHRFSEAFESGFKMSIIEIILMSFFSFLLTCISLAQTCPDQDVS